MPKERDRSHFCASELNVHGLSVLASVIKNQDSDVRQYVLHDVRDLTGIDLLDSKTMSHLTPDQVTMLKHYEFEHVNELVEDLADIKIKDRVGGTTQLSSSRSQPVAQKEVLPEKRSPEVEPEDDLIEDMSEKEWNDQLDNDPEPIESDIHQEDTTGGSLEDQCDDFYDELSEDDEEDCDYYEDDADSSAKPELKNTPSVSPTMPVTEKKSTAVTKVKTAKPIIKDNDKNHNGIPDEDETVYTSSSNRSANALFWFGVFITIVTMAYLFMVTWLPIPSANVRFADMASGFILGILTTVLGFFFGSSMQRTDFHSVVQKTKGGASFHALNNNLQNARNFEQSNFGNGSGCHSQKLK